MSTGLPGTPQLPQRAKAWNTLRRSVKWSERVTSSSILVPSVERALQIAVEPPARPVLLGVPFECILDDLSLTGETRPNRVARAFTIDDQAVQQAVEILLRAQRPVLVTEHAGRDASVVNLLVVSVNPLAFRSEGFGKYSLNFVLFVTSYENYPHLSQWAPVGEGFREFAQTEIIRSSKTPSPFGRGLG